MPPEHVTPPSPTPTLPVESDEMPNGVLPAASSSDVVTPRFDASAVALVSSRRVPRPWRNLRHSGRRHSRGAPVVPGRVRREQTSARRAADAEVGGSFARLRRALLMVLGVICYGTIGYMLIDRMPFADALYMTMITISTVGFTEVAGLDAVGRWFTITVILGGVGTLFFTLTASFELVLSEQFVHWRQKKRMGHAIDVMTGHYIICGYGRIGRQISLDLTEQGMPFLVVDVGQERCALLLEQGVPHVDGDATLDETLLEAGIERARGLVAALNADADNVMTVVTARGLNPTIHIVARAALPEAEKKLRRAGANQVMSPYAVGARRISLSLTRPAVSHFLDAVLYDETLQAEMTEFILAPDSPLCGQNLLEAGMAHGQEVLPLALLREGKLMFSPRPNTVLQAGDVMIIVMPVESLGR